MRVGFKNKMIFVLCALYIYRSLGISVAFLGGSGLLTLLM